MSTPSSTADLMGQESAPKASLGFPAAKIHGMRLVREDEIRTRVAAAFERTRAQLAELVPGARIEHVGSTAVSGSLTKGDLDICVIVTADDLDAVAATLAATYQVHQPENWTEGLASFIAPPDGGVEIGVQLVVSGGTEEHWFIGWRERLRSDPELRARYDRVKQAHMSGSIEDYRGAKEQLILDL
jgi:GrpB-like predicted nucleotidyltransferase (UPF0157 family)